MAQWIPKNKKTGVVYPAISDQEKSAYLADPLLSTRYSFSLVPGSDKVSAPPPIEAKREPKETEEKK